MVFQGLDLGLEVQLGKDHGARAHMLALQEIGYNVIALPGNAYLVTGDNRDIVGMFNNLTYSDSYRGTWVFSCPVEKEPSPALETVLRAEHLRQSAKPDNN